VSPGLGGGNSAFLIGENMKTKNPFESHSSSYRFWQEGYDNPYVESPFTQECQPEDCFLDGQKARINDHPIVGKMFELDGVKYYVGWMRSKAPKDDYGMWLNEQPNGGFGFEFLDFKPEDEENYTKIFIRVSDPR